MDIKKRFSAWVLVALGALLVVLHVLIAPTTLSQLSASRIYNYSLEMHFDNDAEGVNITTYLPQSNERQAVLRETTEAGRLTYGELPDQYSRHVRWSGIQSDTIGYRGLIQTRGVSYTLNPASLIDTDPSEEMAVWLESTEAMPVDHPEIKELWSTIKPQSSRLLVPVVESIFNYVNDEIEGAPFKGFTSALTALRLKQASCNGKGRLLVSLARSNGIPARLIGGIILNSGSKKTSHQWVEFFIEGQWVPFDPTNGHYATLPANYLQLYVGDKVLFTHTSNINFDYLFTINPSIKANYLLENNVESGGLATNLNAAIAMTRSGMSEEAAHIFLLFPLCALVIAFLRNIVGIHTLGVFVPMLIAAACVFTGLVLGLAFYIGIMAVAVLAHWYLERYKMLKVPRLATIITFCTLVIIGFNLMISDQGGIQFGMLSLFPIVIVSFLAERIHEMTSERDWMQMIQATVGTILSTSLCYIIFQSLALQSLFALLPQLLFLVIAAQIFVGRWPGLRLSEYFRFRNIVSEGETLGINNRNLGFVNERNSKELMALAVDKLQTKTALSDLHIPIPGTIKTCTSAAEIDACVDAMKDLSSVVIKPNRGAKGNGILVLSRRDGDDFLTPGGSRWSPRDVRRHFREIIGGAFSQDSNPDVGYLEPLVQQHASLNRLSDHGLADIRIILDRGQPVRAMLRLPTSKSDGKANLHQGAIGLAIDMTTGKVINAASKGKGVTIHPDSGQELIGFEIPYWMRIVEIAIQCHDAIALGYMGVDICLDQNDGPLVLEVNGRPGLEIQNVQKKGMRNELSPNFEAI